LKAKTALIAAVASVGIASAAQADTMYIDLSGWEVWGGFTATPGSNGNSFLILSNFGGGAGTEIVNIEFTNLVFESLGYSWQSELTVSVNDWDGFTYTSFWDSTVPGAAQSPGMMGPVNAAFNNPGSYGSGPFTMAYNDLLITVYESFNDGGNGVQDSVILSGGITITYTPVPAPGALALLGLAGLVGTRRRRA